MKRPSGAELRLGEPRVLTRGRERSERNDEQNGLCKRPKTSREVCKVRKVRKVF